MCVLIILLKNKIAQQCKGNTKLREPCWQENILITECSCIECIYVFLYSFSMVSNIFLIPGILSSYPGLPTVFNVLKLFLLHACVGKHHFLACIEKTWEGLGMRLSNIWTLHVVWLHYKVAENINITDVVEDCQVCSPIRCAILCLST